MKKTFFILLLLSICSIVSARTVKGTVVCGKEKLSGVVVTDGTNFTMTGKKGQFSFEIEDDADFVYIVTPSGYTADWSKGVPAFFQKADKDEFTFELMKTKSPEVYNIIAVGDPQPRSDAHFEEFADIPLNDMAKHGAELEGVVVGVALGDVCYDVLPLQIRWKEEIVRTGFPFYPAVGNHDHDQAYKTEGEAISSFRNNLCPENYAVFLGDDVLMVLDNIIYNGRSNYKEGYTEYVLDWVKGLMNYVSEDAEIYVAQHSPLNGRNYGKMTIGHQEMLDILEGHKVSFISGHNHTHGNFEYAEGVREHNVAAICGTWWDAYHCTDGSPRGFKVFTMKDDHLTWYYKAIGKDRNFQFEIFPIGSGRINPESLVVNVWDYDPCWRVEWYQDGTYMGIVKQVKEYSPLHTAEMEERYQGRKISEYKRTRIADHYFAVTPSADASEVEIKVTDRFGNVFREKVSLK
jgi:hypothetical protein